ncbi:HAD domain-containing protein [Streptacidiphilus neutrinimicus]|uniref:HAD domain-containing protein n=1 Tax=Streptacidiphilus neutrinimicus TaxID=105420 RepID=UPI0005A5D77A|nr:HAD domain-containing protein [Streptacidiphilus neutrinimicus]
MLDVDGPLNPFGAMPDHRPDGFQEHFLMPPSWAALEELRIAAAPRAREPMPLPVWLNPAHGAQLLDLPFELVWATTWEAEANAFISPLLGLPDLPYIAWQAPRRATQGRRCWKTSEIVAWAAGRPFAWVDDEISRADGEWVAEHHSGPALLRRIDPRRGLGAEDFTDLSAWAAELS